MSQIYSWCLTDVEFHKGKDLEAWSKLLTALHCWYYSKKTEEKRTYYGGPRWLGYGFGFFGIEPPSILSMIPIDGFLEYVEYDSGDTCYAQFSIMSEDGHTFLDYILKHIGGDVTYSFVSEDLVGKRFTRRNNDDAKYCCVISTANAYIMNYFPTKEAILESLNEVFETAYETIDDFLEDMQEEIEEFEIIEVEEV